MVSFCKDGPWKKHFLWYPIRLVHHDGPKWYWLRWCERRWVNWVWRASYWEYYIVRSSN